MTSSNKILDIQKIVGDFKVYDFEVEDAHHYVFSNGVLSHNSYVPMKEMSGGCLIAGTQIITKHGLTNIEDVNIDDAVLTKEGVWRTVLDTHFFAQKEVISIEFEDGTRVTCTPEHKFLVDGKWTEAKFLTENISVGQV